MGMWNRYTAHNLTFLLALTRWIEKLVWFNSFLSVCSLEASLAQGLQHWSSKPAVQNSNLWRRAKTICMEMILKDLFSPHVRLYKHFLITKTSFGYWMESDSLRIYLQSSNGKKWQKIFMWMREEVLDWNKGPYSNEYYENICKKYGWCHLISIWIGRSGNVQACWFSGMILAQGARGLRDTLRSGNLPSALDGQHQYVSLDEGVIPR